MLLNLEILNGEMSPKFDKYINTYTVSIKSDITELDLKYEVEDDVFVYVYNNESLVEGKNYVYLELHREEELEVINLEVYKERTSEVINYEELLEPIEVKKDMPEYITPLIIFTCFIIIFAFYKIIFHRRKSK